MVEYDFNKPINAAIIFDSDEDESNQEMNSLPEKHDSDHQKVTKCLDMPSLDGHKSTTEIKLDDVVTKVIKKYIRKTKVISDKKPLKRKSSITSETIKNKLKRKNNKSKKEIRSQHNEPSSSTPNDYKYCQLTSNLLCSSAQPSGLPNEVSCDIRSQNNSCISSSPLNTANIQPITAPIEPKVEPMEDTNPSSFKEITSQRNTSTSKSPPHADNSQPVTCVDQQIKLGRNSRTSPNIASERIRNPLDTSTSSSSENSYNRQPMSTCIELKAKLAGDSHPQSNLSYEITTQQHIVSTSNLPPNTNNKQSISAGTEQEVQPVGHSWASVNDVLEVTRNEFGKIGYQLNTPISSVPLNTDGFCTITNLSEEIKNQHNTSSSSLPTNTNNNTQPVSSDVTIKIQMQQNNVNSSTYDHFKPLLDTVSEHLILILKRNQYCNEVLKGNSEFNEELKKKLHYYKIRLFDLSYSTVVNVMLPRANDKTFVKNFIDNTVLLSKSENRQTIKEISMLYMEMINWVQKMKQRVASESVIDNEIMRHVFAPTVPKTNGLTGIVKESSTYLHSTRNSTYSITPPETQRSSPWIARSNPPPPYSYNLSPPYSNNLPPSYTNIPQNINTMPPQTYVNNVTTPEQTKVPMQKTRRLNQKQVTDAVVARRAVNPTDGPRQDFYSSNITQVNNSNNNRNVNVLSNHAGTYQNYQPSYYVPALPNPNHAQSAYCMNRIPANNSPRATAESEYQKFPRTPRLRNLPNNNTSSENQNHCYRASDLSQGTNNYPTNASLNQANTIQQEFDRSSISRDSGFYSPRDLEVINYINFISNN